MQKRYSQEFKDTLLDFFILGNPAHSFLKNTAWLLQRFINGSTSILSLMKAQSLKLIFRIKKTAG
ncbi:hypothetical protein N42HA_02913 [Lactococcus lactis]|nr:hypothetical protein [Lactococcus lactis]